MKQHFAIMAFGLLMLLPASAQNYKIQTDSIFETMFGKIREENISSEPRYMVCADSLVDYIYRHYGGSKMWGTFRCQISSPVEGDDDKLRQVTSHIIDELSRFPHLQRYSEQIDDGTSLRGRYIVKLKPEGSDTSAYAFLKYDRNLIVFRQSHNERLKTPSHAVSVNSTTADEELSLWRDLRDDFYDNCMLSEANLQVKIQFSKFDGKERKGCYVSNPAPKDGTRFKKILLRFDDKDFISFNIIRKKMNVAGREQGCVSGVFRNDNLFYGKDTCEYYYACRTFPNGLAEFIGATHEDSVTYLVHATSEDPGMYIGAWGKTDFMPREEITKERIKNRAFLGVWVHDEVTDKLLNTAKITIVDKDGQVVSINEPSAFSVLRGKSIWRYYCSALRRDYYKVNVEAEGYEPAYGELTLQPDEPEKQIHIYLKPKPGK